jgi:hypothetical protein
MRNTTLLPILLLFSAHALAAPLKFVEHNFSVEIPPGWSAITPQPPESLLAVQSPGSAVKFLVFATKTSTRQHPDAAREVREGAKQQMTKGGYKIDPDQEMTIGEVAFVAFTAHRPTGGTLTAYTGTAGEEVYMMQVIARDQDAANDPQLQLAIQSFRLLGPPAPPGTSDAPPPLASLSGNKFARLIFTALLFMAALMFFRRLTLRGRK